MRQGDILLLARTLAEARGVKLSTVSRWATEAHIRRCSTGWRLAAAARTAPSSASGDGLGSIGRATSNGRPACRAKSPQEHI
jgi:hypothetical protein